MSHQRKSQFPSIRAALAAAMATLAAAQAPAQTLFDDVRTDYPGATIPYDGVMADFDGNGVPDLALVTPSPSRVTIYLASTNGTFVPPLFVSVPGQAYGIAAGDIDGDGDVDLAVALNFTGAIRLLTNDGAGGFTLGATISTGGSPLDVELANLDGGTDLELVVGVDNTVQTYSNNGAGVFTLHSTTTTGGFVLKVATGDLDGDGDLDVAGVQTGASGLFHAMNNGTGALGAVTNTTAGTNARHLVLSDLDGDSDRDIAVANLDSNNITLHLNNGAGTFAPAVPLAFASKPTSLAAVDLDSDGDRDLVVGGSQGSLSGVLENTGGGVFAAPATYRTGGPAWWVGCADWDADGAPDVAFACEYGLSRFRGNGIALRACEKLAGHTPRVPVVADVDADGHPDVLTLAATAVQVRLTRSDGAGGWASQVSFPLGGVNARAFVACDLNGDSHPDLAAGGLSGTVQVGLNNGSGVFTPLTALSVPGQPNGLAHGDFDGDGDIDLASAQVSGLAVRLLLNDGTGVLSLGGSTTVPAGPGGIAAGDIDGDSDLDLVVSCATAGQVAVLKNDGAGVFSVTSFAVGSGPARLALGDIDGDGDLDIAVPNEDSNTLGLYANNGSGVFSMVSVLPSSGSPVDAVIADIDGDGDADVLVTCLSANQVRVYNNFGGFVLGELAGYEADSGARASVVADLDGNGSPDIVTANEFAGTATILRNSVPSVLSAQVASDQRVLVAFSEEVAGADMVAANYTLSGTGKGTLAAHPASVTVAGPGQRQLTWTMGEMLDGGDVTITVSGAVADLRGNTVGHVKTRTHAGGGIGYPPVAEFSSPAGDYTTTDLFDVELLFSEKLDGFSDSDLVITGAEFQGMDVNEPNYTIHLRATAEGPVTVGLPAGSYVDLAGNAGLEAQSITVTYDATPPGISLASTAPDPVNTAITVTATLTEPSTGFAAGDVTATNATVSGFAGGGTTYSWTLTPSGQGAFSCSVPASAFTDGALHPNTASNMLSRTFDSVPPATSLSTSAPNPTNAPLPFTVTLGEPSTDFTAGDVSVTNGTVAGFSGSGTAYSWSVVPVAQGTVTCSIPAGVYTDAAGNGNTASGVHSRTYDSVAPTVTLTSLAPDPTNGAITVTAALSEPSATFDAGDVSATNASVSAFSGSGTSYSWTLTAAGQGVFSCQVPAGSLEDAATNANTAASNVLARTFDSVAPAITLSTTAPAATNAPITVTATLSEPVAGFDAGDIIPANSAVGDFAGGGTSYSWTLTPASEGVFGCSVPAGAFSDAAANASTAASNALSRTYDATPPVLLLTTPDATRVGPAPMGINFTATDAGSGIASGQVYARAVGGGTWSPLGSIGAGVGTQDFEPAADGVYELTMTGLDAAGNGVATPGAPMLTVIYNADGGAFQHTGMGAGTYLFPMTDEIDVELVLLGAPSPAAAISVNRVVGDGAPAGLNAARLIDEHLVITGALNGATASVKWPFDPASAAGLLGAIESVFRVESGAVAGQFPATVTGGAIEFGPVASFSEWWAGNQPSAVDDWMAMESRMD